MLLICGWWLTNEGEEANPMLLICELWGSSSKSRGPHQFHRWGSDLVLDAQGE